MSHNNTKNKNRRKNINNRIKG